jgi:hypothetical protein
MRFLIRNGLVFRDSPEIYYDFAALLASLTGVNCPSPRWLESSLLLTQVQVGLEVGLVV